MAKFQNFELEVYQSKYERTVDLNLADSSVRCKILGEWLTLEEKQKLLEVDLFYPPVNGTINLRQAIAALYPKATIDNILVTVGTSEANSLVCSTLLEPNDEVIVISPGYRQIWGLAKNIGCCVKELQMFPEDDWRPDLDRLEALTTPKTKLIAIVNPNNPTGTILSLKEMECIVEICAKNGCWLHADEIYQGTELDGNETPTFWNMYEKTICTNSLSKAYGLAGLRVGWAVAPYHMIENLWRRHEYAVVSTNGPGMMLAEIALQKDKRHRLFEDQRELCRQGHALLNKWLHEQKGLFSVRPCPATSNGFVKYHFDMPSFEFAEHIRTQTSVLIAPGIYLGSENHIRITVGYEPLRIQEALNRIARVAANLA